MAPGVRVGSPKASPCSSTDESSSLRDAPASSIANASHESSGTLSISSALPAGLKPVDGAETSTATDSSVASALKAIGCSSASAAACLKAAASSALVSPDATAASIAASGST
jgi:hypothetical protein